ncbi:MAG: hypothetical protein ACTHLA_03490 [Asticcacaulis sp.]|uniref:hypothetical protein n=1 Tax=Asticcacaulis sp. TaxID=1872648 RepID=UPI003F7C708A
MLNWSNRAIRALQTTQLICFFSKYHSGRLTPEKEADEMLKLAFETSILVEQGRLFFKNKIVDDYGSKKPEAYRGYRARILDYIVVCHQIACEWGEASDEDKGIMHKISEACERQFVSLVQKEVGRGQTASVVTKQAGDGVHLQTLINEARRGHLDLG